MAVSLQVKHPMTMTEKILAAHSGNGQVRPGDNIWTNVDKLLTHDVCGPGTFGIFQREFGMDAEVCAETGPRLHMFWIAWVCWLLFSSCTAVPLSVAIA